MLTRLETYDPIVMSPFGKKITLKQGKIEKVHSVFLLLLNYAENTLKNSTLNFNTSFCWSHTAKRNPKNGKWLLSSKTSRTFPTDFPLKSNRKYHSSRLPIINIVDQLLEAFRTNLMKWLLYLWSFMEQRKRASTIVTAVLEQMKVKDYVSVEI